MINKYIYVGLVSFIVFSFFIFSHETSTSRSIYEDFLVREYQKSINPYTESEKLLLDNPEMAMMQNHYMLIDPILKRVPAERLAKAYDYTLNQIIKNKVNLRDEITWNKVESNMGGRTRGIMWDPNISNKVWACSVSGGLYYNSDITNNNSKWKIVNDFWPGLSTNCVTFDPNNNKVFYVGTGEYHTARNTYRESSGIGYGIWKSIDSGKTWSLIESTKEFKYISDIKVKNENGVSVIYAGVVSGVYKETLHESVPTEGLYRSIDNGQNWEQVLPKITNTNLYYAPSDIEISADGKIFVGTLKNKEGKGGATILSSDSGTKGSWKVFDKYNKIITKDSFYPIPGRVVLGAAPSDKNTIYALIGAGFYNEYNFNLSKGNYILKSIDGGDTWNSKPLPQGDPNWASLSWHAFAITVNPTDPNNVFVGGLDLWKSVNGGNNWAHTSNWYLMNQGGGDDYVHADQHSIAYKPNSSTEAIFSTDGGVFYSSNANDNLPIYVEKNKNLSCLQFYSCDLSPVQNQNIFIGGLQDNGSLLYTGNTLNINNMISGGDGAYSFFDQDNPETMITSVYYNQYYIFKNYEYIGKAGIYGTGVFINPCDYDSKNNTLYTNACSFTGEKANELLKITNITDEPINEYITLNTKLNTYFSHIKVSPYAQDGNTTLFIGSQNGQLFKVSDAQSTPNTYEIGSDKFPAANISSIAIGGSEDTLLVTFSNYGIQSIWESYDGGKSWVDISYNLPDMPVRWSIYHPENSKQILIATELGIWTKTNSNSWAPISSFPNVRVDMIKVRKSDNTVLAATHGQGFFWTKWNYKPVGIIEKRIQDINIFPNPSNGILNINSKSNDESIFRIYNLNGKLVSNGVLDNSGNTKVNLTSSKNGIYIIKIVKGNQYYSKKLIIVKNI